MSDVDLKTLAADWTWLIDLDAFELRTISPFGDLLLQNRAGDFYLLDINGGALDEAQTSGEDPARLFPDYFDGRLEYKYRQAQLFLTPGTCYGYKRQTVLDGSYEIENVYVANLREYVSFMGDFHRQIKDIPDGTKIRLVAK